MNNENLEGARFLNELYKELSKSEEVKSRAENGDREPEKIDRWMEELEQLHERARSKEHLKKMLYSLYHNKYVIKKENFPEYFSDEEKNNIINEQEKTLDRWLDYLQDENAKYPMWVKYWAFQGMLKIGTYNEGTATYQKRNNKTIAPFIDANPEIIAKCIDVVRKYVKSNSQEKKAMLNDNFSTSFSKLYAALYIHDKENLSKKNGNEGKWIKYNQGSKEDAKRLCASLQNKQTGWCTAGESTAIAQVCGDDYYAGGDFYVYYTMDDKGEYTIPRIAIRMDGMDEIGEIRGVADGQNLEEGLENIVENQLNKIKGLKDDSKKDALVQVENSRKLTLLLQKVTNGVQLSEDELKYIFLEDIETFGWDDDPRIEKIKSKISITDKKLALKLLDMLDNGFKYISDNLKKDREVTLLAVSKDGCALGGASEELKNDKEVVMSAISDDGTALYYASENMKKDRDVVMTAVRKNGTTLDYASKELQDDREIVMAAVSSSGMALASASNRLKHDREVIKIAIKNDGYALCCVPEELKKDKELIMLAVSNNSNAFFLAPEELKDDKEFVLTIIKIDGRAYTHASRRLKKDKEVAMAAVKNCGETLNKVPRPLRHDKELIMAAVSNDGDVIRHLDMLDWNLKHDREVVLLALKSKNYSNAYGIIPMDLRSDKEIMLVAVSNNGMDLRYASEELQDDIDVVMTAVSNNSNAIQYASERLKKDEEILRKTERK